MQTDLCYCLIILFGSIFEAKVRISIHAHLKSSQERDEMLIIYLSTTPRSNLGGGGEGLEEREGRGEVELGKSPKQK